MSTINRVHLAQQATARAHLAGAEAAALTAHMRTFGTASVQLMAVPEYVTTLRARDAARRLYWREIAGAAALVGMTWPDAEALGEEP